jgi:hypothetical protein
MRSLMLPCVVSYYHLRVSNNLDPRHDAVTPSLPSSNKGKVLEEWSAGECRTTKNNKRTKLPKLPKLKKEQANQQLPKLTQEQKAKTKPPRIYGRYLWIWKRKGDTSETDICSLESGCMECNSETKKLVYYHLAAADPSFCTTIVF